MEDGAVVVVKLALGGKIRGACVVITGSNGSSNDVGSLTNVKLDLGVR